MPPPNFGGNLYSFNPISTNKFNQYISRIDHNFSSKDSIFGYWFYEQDNTLEDESFYGGSLPGFGDSSASRVQILNLTWNHTFSSSLLNEAKVGYNRLGFNTVNPQQVVQPSSLGFTGIVPQNPKVAGAPCVLVVGLRSGECTFGFSIDGPQPRIDQTYQASDNLSWIKGRHTVKAGFDMRRSGVENPFYYVHNGIIEFLGGGTFSTGNPIADFLLGTPDAYEQSSGGFIDARAQEYYSYVQDQFKIRSNLTLTFGTGWQVNMPIKDLWNGGVAINAYRPGAQSTVFPTAPLGLLFPGDTGVNTAGYDPKYTHFGPRLGFAWSPGTSSKWSLRGGFGVYYNQVEEELTLQNLLAPPISLVDYGVGDVGGSPSFAAPYVDVAGRGSIANKYPYTAPAKGSNFDFSLAMPFSLNVIAPSFTTPRAFNYNLTVERQISGSTIASVAYVGHQGRHLETAYEVNPAGQNGANPACAALYPACNPYTLGYPPAYGGAPGSFRNPLVYPPTVGGIVFGSVGEQATDANSNYNSLQAQITRHTSRGLEFQASYTWSHSFDNTSSFENAGSNAAPNPFNLESNYADSGYDARQRLVFSYSYEVPSVRHYQSFHAVPSRLTDGWRLAGVTTFQTGFPIDVFDSSDDSLTCFAAVAFYGCPDRPNVVGPVQRADPRTSTYTNNNPAGTGAPADHYYFNPNSFATETLGVLGNAGRNLFHGPGFNNWTLGLYKDTHITESTRIELRFEFFNIFNHTQFRNPVADVNDPNFGRVLQARDPRVVQLAAKFIF